MVFHFAGQTAVTTSVTNPRKDFNTNALGTFNVLEAIRKSNSKPIILYTSTNKVYGKMDHMKVKEENGRYTYERPEGASEKEPLDFHSPYGCSKGAADQYIHDYNRIYGIKSIVFRQSCIYGYRQFGVEDQGWVAWFCLASLFNKNITIYGDGKQVRDVLFITDLIRAFDLAIENIETTSGQVYNIGGGPDKTLSILELLEILGQEFDKKINVAYDDWRPGDQKVFICNIDKAQKDFNWKPTVDVKEGVVKLINWAKEHKHLFGHFN